MKKSQKNLIYNVLMAVCAVAFIGSAGMLGRKLYEEKKQEDAFSQLNDVFITVEDYQETAGGSATDISETPDRDPVTGEFDLTAVEESSLADWNVRLAGYETLWAKNQDFVGWIRIDGTQIDYPVMHSPDRPDYYLHRNFDKNQSAYGVPYLSEYCEPGVGGTNLLIYGHHMKNGSMFAGLDGYRDADFYKEHPFIRFDTLEDASVYEVIGAWLIPNAASVEQVNELYHVLLPQSEEEFQAGWNAVSRRMFFPAATVPTTDKRLLALVTCDYSYNDSRIVVLAQQIAETAEKSN